MPLTAVVDHRNDDTYCVIRFSDPMGLEATHVVEGDKHVAHGRPVNETTRLLVETLMRTAGITEVRVVAAEQVAGKPVLCNVSAGWPKVTSSWSDVIATRVAVSRAAWDAVSRLFPEVVLKQAFWEHTQY